MNKFIYSLFSSKNYFLLFPLSLVIFEFTVYITNDMIQPVMLEIVKYFNTSIDWVPVSLTSYLFGGFCLQWLLGPLSDKVGRRPVMLLGVLYFIFCCLIILLTCNIKQFIMVRFLQGIGICFISTVGYASIQDYCDEKLYTKVMSIMSNITLMSPLLGPLIGSLLINLINWKYMFVIFSLLAFISFISLFIFMPETVLIKETSKTDFFKPIINNYRNIFTNINVVYGSIAIGFADLPLISWISLSPVILINEMKFSNLESFFLQTPIFLGLVIGNSLLYFLSKKNKLTKIIKIGSIPMFISTLLFLISFFYSSFYFTIVSLSVYACGLGITNSCLIRLTLLSSKISKGTVSSAISMISMSIFLLETAISKKMFFYGHKYLFNIINSFSIVMWLILIVLFTNRIIFISKKYSTNIQ